jgi:hypothetical protein
MEQWMDAELQTREIAGVFMDPEVDPSRACLRSMQSDFDCNTNTEAAGRHGESASPCGIHIPYLSIWNVLGGCLLVSPTRFCASFHISHCCRNNGLDNVEIKMNTISGLFSFEMNMEKFT